MALTSDRTSFLPRLNTVPKPLPFGAADLPAGALAEAGFFHLVPHFLRDIEQVVELTALAEPLRGRNIFVSLRQDALRIGPNNYNREWEIERLLAVLAE